MTTDPFKFAAFTLCPRAAELSWIQAIHAGKAGADGYRSNRFALSRGQAQPAISGRSLSSSLPPSFARGRHAADFLSQRASCFTTPFVISNRPRAAVASLLGAWGF
jgi:hypothetical protein